MASVDAASPLTRPSSASRRSLPTIAPQNVDGPGRCRPHPDREARSAVLDSRSLSSKLRRRPQTSHPSKSASAGGADEYAHDHQPILAALLRPTFEWQCSTVVKSSGDKYSPLRCVASLTVIAHVRSPAMWSCCCLSFDYPLTMAVQISRPHLILRGPPRVIS